MIHPTTDVETEMQLESDFSYLFIYFFLANKHAYITSIGLYPYKSGKNDGHHFLYFFIGH